MRTDDLADLERRAAVHAALADPARLRITDTLSAGDASPSELARCWRCRRTCSPTTCACSRRRGWSPAAVLMVTGGVPTCGWNPARWTCPGARRCRGRAAAVRVHRQLGALSPGGGAVAAGQRVPAVSAGTHPAEAIDPGRSPPRSGASCRCPGSGRGISAMSGTTADLIVSVCDLAHEELGAAAAVHWSVPDPCRLATPQASTRCWPSSAAGSGCSPPGSRTPPDLFPRPWPGPPALARWRPARRRRRRSRREWRKGGIAACRRGDAGPGGGGNRPGGDQRRVEHAVEDGVPVRAPVDRPRGWPRSA